MDLRQFRMFALIASRGTATPRIEHINWTSTTLVTPAVANHMLSAFPRADIILTCIQGNRFCECSGATESDQTGSEHESMFGCRIPCVSYGATPNFR